MSQSGKNFYLDYILVDGGSNDGTVEVIEKYEKILRANCSIESKLGLNFYISDKPAFEYNQCCGVSYRWITEPDKGHGDALNKGFAKAKGEIFAWLNSDDKYHPNAFSAVADIFSQFEEVRWIIGKYSWWNQKGECVREQRVFKNLFDYLLGEYEWIQQESTFWRKSLWEEAGGKISSDYKLMVDGELWSRFFQLAPVFHVDQVLSGFRVHAENRSRSARELVQKEMDDITEKLRNTVPLETSPSYYSLSKDTEWRINKLPQNAFKEAMLKIRQLSCQVRTLKKKIATLEAQLNASGK